MNVFNHILYFHFEIEHMSLILYNDSRVEMRLHACMHLYIYIYIIYIYIYVYIYICIYKSYSSLTIPDYFYTFFFCPCNPNWNSTGKKSAFN